MSETVLFVDDEEQVLKALDRIFVDEKIRILHAHSAEEALEIIKKENIAVIVSDNRMPGMNGVGLLSHAKELIPDTTRVLMTAYVDLPTTIDAINKGEIFRFISKPWKDSELVRAVKEGINRYRIVSTLKKADEGSLRSLARTIELKDRYTSGHCDRVADYALMVADELQLPAAMKKEIERGSWLHDLGKIGVPETLLNRKGPLNDNEYTLIKQHPRWGAEVAMQAHLSTIAVNVILYHHERYDGKGYPSGLAGEAIPFEARIVAIADVYDALTTNRSYRKRFAENMAVCMMSALKGKIFDPVMVDAFLRRLLNRGGDRGCNMQTGTWDIQVRKP